MQNTFWTAIKKFFSKTREFLFSKDSLVFLFFLIISATFWFILSQKRETEFTIRIPLVYSNISDDILITNELPKNLRVVVRDAGLNKLLYNYKKDQTPIVVDVDEVLRENEMVKVGTSQYQHLILRRLGANAELLDIIPDTIRIHHEKLTDKVVPVNLNASFHLGQQSIMSAEAYTEPSEIKVFSTDEILETISIVQTDSLKLTDLTDTVRVKLALTPIKKTKYETDSVMVVVPVEAFTEKTVSVPIIVKNVPENVVLRVFPNTINVTFCVGLSQYKKVSLIDFGFYVDYNDLKKNQNQAGLKVYKQREPDYITNVRFSDYVEYLVEYKSND